ncbi:MAG: peptide ABC transporter substrate-binding protein [Spirochaetaceae bacterium]|nr:peptide ABC transporter substrate-binding protein [Spirochaetaceae bacterium]
MKKTYTFLAFLLPFLAFLPPLGAQEEIPEAEAAQSSEQSRFDSAMQRELVILDSPHEYDFNPYTANFSNEAQLFTGLYEGLFSYDPYSLEPVTALAESHRISRDKKIWTFTLRKNARYSNGDLITAESMRQSWLALLAPKTAAPFASLIDCISGAAAYRTGTGRAEDVGISVRDTWTLVVRLDTPTEHLPRILCHHAFAAVHPTPGVYSGAFTLDQTDDTRIRLVKNFRYRDQEKVALPSVLIHLSDDRDENAYLVNTGQANWSTSVINTDKLLDLETVKIFGEFATEYLFFKTTRSPWDKSAFRMALLTAVPWESLRSKSLVPAKTFIYPLMGYTSPQGFSETDEYEARLMLDQAKKDNGMQTDDPVTMVIAISDTEYMKGAAEILSGAWEKIGVTVRVEVTPANRYLDSIASWEADLFSYIWIGDFADPVAFLELFRGASSLNPSGWRSADFDRLMSEAASVADTKRRYQILAEAEALLLDSGEVLPISHPVSLNVIDLNALGGWYRNALDIHPLKSIYFTGKDGSLPNLVRKD